LSKKSNGARAPYSLCRKGGEEKQSLPDRDKNKDVMRGHGCHAYEAIAGQEGLQRRADRPPTKN